MNIEQARALQQEGKLTSADIFPNPNEPTEWFAMVRKISGKSFMLVDDEDAVISVADAGELLNLLKSLGFRQVLAHL